ncbi:MAG TPA: hypothetical protein VMY35_02520 [Phycisphaerae bacterium]|nr:hypothetical protein [Phycisphaerae bacterium]
MDASEKNIQALLQRTRPDALGPQYNRQPAGRPPVPPAGVETMWCRIVDGRDHGEDFPYPVAGVCTPEGASCWWIDEVNPVTYEPFYPSRTRNAANEYQFTKAEDFYRFWPAPIGLIVPVRRWKWDGGSPSLLWVAFGTAPPCCHAKVTQINASGIVTRVEWMNTYNAALGYGQNVWLLHLATGPWPPPPTGYVYYPYPKVGDWIMVACPSPASWPGGVPQWVDMTPRIPLHSQAKVGASTERDVNVDISGGAPGVPWILDTDT